MPRFCSINKRPKYRGFYGRYPEPETEETFPKLHFVIAYSNFHKTHQIFFRCPSIKDESLYAISAYLEKNKATLGHFFLSMTT